MRKRILFIHSDDPAMEQLRKCLEHEALEVTRAALMGDPLELWRREQPDALIFHAGTAIWEAVDACARLRAHARLGDTPVVLIGETLSKTDRIIALELGVSDYISQPFSPREAVARIKVHLRRAACSRDVLRAGTLELDRARCEVRLEGRRVSLTANEFRVLEALMSRAGVVLSERELLRCGWGGIHN